MLIIKYLFKLYYGPTILTVFVNVANEECAHTIT